MADNKVFMGPNYDKIMGIGEDSQIKTIPIEAPEWGGRKSAQPSKISNAFPISHVSGKNS
jgi:hypothetical protein